MTTDKITITDIITSFKSTDHQHYIQDDMTSLHQCEMAPSVSVNFISLVTSCVELEGATNGLSHVLYMGVSYSCECADGTLNSTQSISPVFAVFLHKSLSRSDHY